MVKSMKYSIGLDIGTGSVGHVALNSDYNLLRYKGRYAWGSRLFDGAQTAEVTRTKRGARRGYRRRKNRIQLLQEIMNPTLIDYPQFLRVNNALEKTWKETNMFENRSLSEVLFEIGGTKYCEKYPTIYHLRHALFETKEQVDPRLVYLAIHNVTKFRGHFLYDSLDPSQGASNEDESKMQLEQFINQAFELVHMEAIGYDIDEVWNILSDTKVKKGLRLEQLNVLFGKKFTGVFFKLLLGGYKVKLQSIFEDFEDRLATIDLSKEESDDMIEQLPDNQVSFMENAKHINSGIILKNLLSGSKTIAEAKVKKYDHFQQQLKEVKDLLFHYDKDVYKEVFVSSKKAMRNYEKHHHLDDLCLFDKFRYQKKESVGAKARLYKKLKTVFENIEGSLKADFYLEQIEEGVLFERLNGVENRAIPMQCSSYEAVTILKNQNYSAEIIDKVKALIEFRIPYYVGPLVKVKENNEGRFSWAIRKEGMEAERITPWNFDQVIDKDKSGAAFINRMRNMCTYLYKEETLPKYSLLYQEYEVLNELNGISWMIGEKKTAESKFTADEKDWIIKNVFKKTKTVSVKKLKDELQKSHFYHVRNGKDRNIKGTQKETSFASSLSSWIDFTAVFGEINDTNYDMIEEIILWLTLFTEKEIIERSIRNNYRNVTEKQIQKILKLTSKYKGYGRLSRKLLDGIVDTTDHHKTIIEHMREKPTVFMRVLTDARYEYKSVIEKENQFEKSDKTHFSYQDDVKPIPGSPAVKRSIWQSLKIVDEYVRLFGIPERIVIEMPREDDMRNKNKRTKSREEQWEVMKKELKGSGILDNVETIKNENVNDDRVWLYLHQNGKCMYSGEKLEISHLDQYDIDHILPRRFIKDDSLDNKVLVLNRLNAEKSGDKLPLDVANPKMIQTWRTMHEKRLISSKKFHNLMRRTLTDEDKMGFIARQLVETRQVTKHVVRILENRFMDEDGTSNVVVTTLKPDIVSKLKKDMGIIKIREAGDKHHAVDAFMCAWLDRFMEKTYGRNIFQFEFGNDLKETQKWFLSNVLYKSRKGEKNDGDSDFFLFRDAKEWVHTNEVTGEVRSHAIPYFKKVVYDTPCQFTRKLNGPPAQLSGETIFSPKNKTEGTPFPNSKKSEKGLYSKLKKAYVCLVEYTEVSPKKSTRKVKLIDVTVINNIVYGKLPNEILAEILIRENLEIKKNIQLENCKIIKRIEIGQLIRSNGNHLFRVISSGELGNEKQPNFSKDTYEIYTNHENLDYNVASEIFENTKKYVLQNFKELLTDEKLRDYVEKAPYTQQNLRDLITLTSRNYVRKALFGSEKKMSTRYTRRPKLEETVLIHQSITGLEIREEKLMKGE